MIISTLGYNKIGAEGAGKIALALEKNTSLTTLDLSKFFKIIRKSTGILNNFYYSFENDDFNIRE